MKFLNKLYCMYLRWRIHKVVNRKTNLKFYKQPPIPYKLFNIDDTPFKL